MIVKRTRCAFSDMAFVIVITSAILINIYPFVLFLFISEIPMSFKIFDSKYISNVNINNSSNMPGPCGLDPRNLSCIPPSCSIEPLQPGCPSQIE
jgi:hypothetical protein